MLHVSKKNLLIANALRFVGTLLILCYLPLTYFQSRFGLVPLIIGGVLSIWGGLKRTDLFICPVCGHKILRGGGFFDQLLNRVPYECYNCKAYIEVVKDKD